MKRGAIMFNKKSCLILAAMFLLTACGGDSGSNESEPEYEPEYDPLSVWMYEDLPECNKSLEGTTMYVETEHEHHICSDNQWTLVEESNKDISLDEDDEDDLGECTDENEGEIKESAYSIRMKLGDFQICEDGRWRSASSEDREKNGWGSAKDGAIRQGEITKSLYKYDEAARQWIFANMYDTLYGLDGCTQSKYKMVAEGKDGHTYVCENERDHSEYLTDRWEWRGQSYTEAATGAICSYEDIGETKTFLTSMECVGFGRWIAFSGITNEEPLVDMRDGHEYATVNIGTQTWMAENLNYESPNSRCYNDSIELCSKYGRLYTWGDAMDSIRTGCGYGDSCSVAGNNQGICPEGWHLPNETEWYTLDASVSDNFKYNGGKALKTRMDWDEHGGKDGNGDDSYGFGALPSGVWDGMGRGLYRDLGARTCYWLSNEGDFLFIPTITYDPEMLAHTRLDTAKHVVVHNSGDNTLVLPTKKYDGCSIRCLKD